MANFLVAGAFGEGSTGVCHIRTGTQHFDILKMVYNTLFSFFTIGFCFAISGMVVYKVKRTQPNTAEKDSTIPPEEKLAITRLKRLINRTCLYPVACFLAYVGSNTSMTYYFILKENSSFLVAWQKMGYSSRGMLHLFAFLADPIILETLKGLFEQQKRQVSDYPFRPLDQESGCSYEALTSPIPSGSSASVLRKRMVRDFRKNI